MDDIIRTIDFRDTDGSNLGDERREWLVANGLGGYACGTVTGIISRRYHGVLVAALPAPLGRIMMCDYIFEKIRFPDGALEFSGEPLERQTTTPAKAEFLQEFRLENGLPVWLYNIRGVILEKRLVMPNKQNTTIIIYQRLDEGEPVQLELRPGLYIRPHDQPMGSPVSSDYSLTVTGERYEINAGHGMPSLRMIINGDHVSFTIKSGILREVYCRIEEERGYDCRGSLWSPGSFLMNLNPGGKGTAIMSTAHWAEILAMTPEEAFQAESIRRNALFNLAKTKNKTGFTGELLMAADQFIFTPIGRREDTARAHAAGEEVRSVIAGYHWFTDWGRDTMISFEGLTLTTGRYNEGGWILRTFSHYIRDGLLPNMFPEGEREGRYHTADATLWYFHAIDRYLEVTGNCHLLTQILPNLIDIIEHHKSGTRFGIAMDPSDGLLRQGAEGYQLTWMDAKVEDWVVTPRRGKAVEINALWYNALRLLEKWITSERGADSANTYKEAADRAFESFNKRFWYDKGGYLYDVIDGVSGSDTSLRPNQIFSFSLRNPILEQQRWEQVLNVVQDRLLTPMGLRSLAPGEPDYKVKYFGDLRSRDAAYHQGTIWAWLIGPFVDAWLRVHPDDLSGARNFLSGFEEHLSEFCMGSIAEIFDAEQPFAAHGCISQAWSVAEVLRCLKKTEG